MAVVLAATSLSAASQDKSDYFGQSPSAQSAPAAPEPRRVIIQNRDQSGQVEPAPADDADSGETLQDRRAGETDGAPRTAKTRPVRRASERAVPSEFQQFIRDSTGKLLPVFGASFFQAGAATFAPIGGAPVPDEYLLSPGDELLIRGWGSIDIDYRAKIDRNGLISIPTVGSVVLAGVKAGDAQAVVKGAVARLYKGVTISVNFGQLRAITVYVVGQARRPGTYTVSSLSTLVTAVFASGGPNQNGSMRRVQVKRAGILVAELDLYAFLAKGDKGADIKLRDGDTIVIPAAAGHVALMGKVNTPAIYELRGKDDTIASLLEFAGGTAIVADPRRAFLERVDPTRSQPRSVEQFELNGAGLQRSLKDGDVLNVTSITPDFSNAVVLRGNVDQAVRVPFVPGMRVSDLIPNREYLISRKSVQRQNRVLDMDSAGKSDGRARDQEHEALRDSVAAREPGVAGPDTAAPDTDRNADTLAARIGGLIDEINWEYAVVER
ncbi:MAG TPA: SLBB domain-containing protein, partial [Telluria sp.]|nr:SLBB domain-containing protein [Telluria sp.]